MKPIEEVGVRLTREEDNADSVWQEIASLVISGRAGELKLIFLLNNNGVYSFAEWNFVPILRVHSIGRVSIIH